MGRKTFEVEEKVICREGITIAFAVDQRHEIFYFLGHESMQHAESSNVLLPPAIRHWRVRSKSAEKVVTMLSVETYIVPTPTPRTKRVRVMHLLDLPVELGELLLGYLDGKSLSTIACVCQTLNQQSSRTIRWKLLFEDKWGTATKLQHQAAELAGGWKHLYVCKFPLRETCPCKWEVRAALEAVTACTSSKGVACCVLMDGSGSMAPGDFDSMARVVTQLSGALEQCPDSRFCVIQFSGRAQVEIPLQKPGDIDCAAIMKRVTRMSGGTNAAAACIRAAAELEQLDADVQRVIIFMSDFRIDEYSAHEAVEAAKELAKEQPKTSFFAFGVGHFVDKKLVENLLAIGSPGHSMDAYILLGCKDDSPIDSY